MFKLGCMGDGITWFGSCCARTPDHPHRHRLAPLSQPCFAPLRSCDKKLLQLGWQEKTNWEDGLRKTVDWYLKNATRDYWCAAAVLISPDALSSCNVTGCLSAWLLQSLENYCCSGLLSVVAAAGTATLPQHAQVAAADLALLPTFLLPCHRSHGDMELALDAHPTLQVPYMGSAAFALKA